MQNADATAFDIRVKICGITRLVDADAAIELGVEMLGINLVPASSRRVTPQLARQIVEHVNGRCEVIAVVADLSLPELLAVRQETGVDALQLHGSEVPEVFQGLAAADYKAIRIANAADVARAARYPGARILVDAFVPGVLGGSGHVFDWNLVLQLARERQLLLAGGLTPLNVAAAVQQVRPFAVDSASGVESAAGVKDAELMRRFVAQARAGARVGG